MTSLSWACTSAWGEAQQNEVRLQALVDLLQCLLTCGGGLNLVVVDFKQRADVTQHARFVVHQQDFGGLLHRFFPLLAAAIAGLYGTRKENLQPAPGSLSTQILPPMPCTSRRAIANPKPIPS